MYFSYVVVCATLSDDRINDGYMKSLITKIAEEWVMVDSRGFEENAISKEYSSSASFILETVPGKTGCHAGS